MTSPAIVASTWHRLYIRLDRIDPPIDREFVVPSNLSLDRLHHVIQAIMGWEDEHLHEFVAHASRKRSAVDDETQTLQQIAPRKGMRFGYRYDFGDDWYHTVEVRDVLDQAPAPSPLLCLGASGACPPEDCGGPWGYAHLLEALADPGHQDHEDMREWMGGDFDPAACDIDHVNAILAGLARRWRLPSANVAAQGAAGKSAVVKGKTATAAAAPTRQVTGQAARRSAPPGRVDEMAAGAFVETYKAVLLDIAGPAASDDGLVAHLAEARDLLVRQPTRLDDAVTRLRKAGTELDEDVLLAMRDIRLQRWVYLRDTRSHSIFLEPTGDTAYGVLGLNQRIRDIAGESGLVVEAALLTYRDHVVCDGLIAVVAWLGPNLRRQCNADLSRARATGRYTSRALFPRAADRPEGRGGEAVRTAEPAKDQRSAYAASVDAQEAAPAASSPTEASDQPPARSDLVVIATPGKAATRSQRTFNRLAEQVRRKRQELTDWQRWLASYSERLAGELAPLQRQLYDAELQRVRRLDALLASKAGTNLSKPRRAALQRHLDECIRQLLDAGGPDEDELGALLRKHAGEDLQDLRERERLLEKELAQTLIGEVFGEDMLREHRGDDAESLFRHVEEKLRQREAGKEQAAPRGKRARIAAERLAQAQREASQSVRDVFRKLASSLHPDRESDPQQRARKTELMQQATRAYQNNDLLQLLTLQIQVEQIDDRYLAGLPDARLEHYNAVLRDQLAALEGELAALVQSLAIEMQMPTPAPTRNQFQRELDVRVAHWRQWCVEVEAEAAALGDERGRNELAAALQARFRDEDASAGLDELDYLFGMMDTDTPQSDFPGDVPAPIHERTSSLSAKRNEKNKRKNRRR